MQARTKTHHFEIKNAKIFWGGGIRSPDHPPSVPTAPRSSRIWCSSSTWHPPKKNPSYSLDESDKYLLDLVDKCCNSTTDSDCNMKYTRNCLW